MRLAKRILHGLTAGVKFVFMPFAMIWERLETAVCNNMLFIVIFRPQVLAILAGNKSGPEVKETHEDLDAEKLQAVEA